MLLLRCIQISEELKRFGFSVQSGIWENVEEDYTKFSDPVEWRLNYSWQQYTDLIFKMEALIGHLPARPLFKSSLAISWATTLMPRLAKCYGNDF